VPVPSQVRLYVADPMLSAAFYADLLPHSPSLACPDRAMFSLSPGMKLGLCARSKVEPPAPATGSALELCFTVPDIEALRALHTLWILKGVFIAQGPKGTGFGGSAFVGMDPDGHRLRVITSDQALG
jgi:hypothetical protein